MKTNYLAHHLKRITPDLLLQTPNIMVEEIRLPCLPLNSAILLVVTLFLAYEASAVGIVL
jgi:hypothetical protein